MWVYPFAIVLAFNAERPVLMSKLYKVRFFGSVVGADSLGRRCLRIPTLMAFRPIKVEHALKGEEAVGIIDGLKASICDDLQGIANMVGEVSCNAGIEGRQLVKPGIDGLGRCR